MIIPPVLFAIEGTADKMKSRVIKSALCIVFCIMIFGGCSQTDLDKSDVSQTEKAETTQITTEITTEEETTEEETTAEETTEEKTTAEETTEEETTERPKEEKSKENESEASENKAVPNNKAQSGSYILNTNTYKFHYPDCRAVKKMKDENKESFTGSRDEVIAMGYSPCAICSP